jgi:hypothetical protein
MSGLTWETQNGEAIPIECLNDSHLDNIINMIEKKAKEGMLFQSGGGHDALDMWYEEDVIYGQDVYDYYGIYEELIEERNKRRTQMGKSKIAPTKVVVGVGETKNIGNFESIRVYNELEAPVLEGQKVADIQEELRKAVIKLNERDFNAMLGNE